MAPISGGRAITSCAAAALVLLLGSCASASGPEAKSTASVHVDGAWGQEFTDAIADSKSAYEQSVLSDGVVSVAELEDAHQRVDRCLRDSGYTINYFADGGFEIDSTRGEAPSNDMEKTNRVLEACEAKFDRYITSLYQETRRNPEKQDDATITVACLREADLVGADYTPKRWQRDYDAQRFPFDEWSAEAKQCEYDPLGLWRDK